MFSEYPYLNFADFNLDWVIRTVKELLKLVESWKDWKDDVDSDIKTLQEFYNALISGNFTPEMLQALNTWAANHVPDILQAAVKNVWFGLTDDGYFVAWIPESWSDINFETTGYDVDLAGYDYGHLVLMA